MARRVNPTPEENEEHTPLEGGAAGIPAEIGAIAATMQREVQREAAPPVPVRRFIVEGSGKPGIPGYQVQYNGTIALLRTGKEVDDVNYDIEGLKAQGVRLREVQPR